MRRALPSPRGRRPISRESWRSAPATARPERRQTQEFISVRTQLPTTASGETRGEGGITNCIGFTFTWLPLASLRANSQLLEIDASVLRFDLQETREFLEHEKPGSLELADVKLLHCRGFSPLWG
jgi:hypothetical protein